MSMQVLVRLSKVTVLGKSSRGKSAEWSLKDISMTWTNDQWNNDQGRQGAHQHISTSTSSSNDQVVSGLRSAQGDWGCQRQLETILITFNHYAPVINVMISHQPHVTAIVWGTMRGLLRVSKCYSETPISPFIACHTKTHLIRLFIPATGT